MNEAAQQELADVAEAMKSGMMDEMLVTGIEMSEKALGIMADSTLPASIAKFIARLYDSLKETGFTEEDALELVKTFNTASFLGQKR